MSNTGAGLMLLSLQLGIHPRNVYAPTFSSSSCSFHVRGLLWKWVRGFLGFFFWWPSVIYRRVGAAVEGGEWSVMQIKALWFYNCSCRRSVKRKQSHSESFDETSANVFLEIFMSTWYLFGTKSVAGGSENHSKCQEIKKIPFVWDAGIKDLMDNMEI